MNVKVITGVKLLKIFGIKAITLYPFILMTDSAKDLNKNKDSALTTLRHEMVHVHQVRQCGWLFFYGLYLYYWFKNLLHFRRLAKSNISWLLSMAYYNIPFEIEAYTFEIEPFTWEEIKELAEIGVKI